MVDLGSNSVRLVVFEGRGRNPVAIFNEKAVLRLGRGMQATGRLNDAGVAQALRVMGRYHAIARAMGAEPFEVLATAAVRDASNGAEFVASLEAVMPGTPIRVLSGQEEAALSSAGVLSSIQGARGILADIGGGSLELVRLDAAGAHDAATLRLGVIRLSERSNGDLAAARQIAEDDLAALPWLEGGRDGALLLVGGAWRALARVQMLRTAYPLGIVHNFSVTREAARELTSVVLDNPRRGLDRLAGASKRRVDDLPFAAVVLRRLLRRTAARRVVFSAAGIREGWYQRHLPASVREQDPMLAAAHSLAAQTARDPAMPGALLAWTAPLFPQEPPEAARLREAACWMSDAGSHDHPEYRAEQAFLRVLRDPGAGLDHPARVFLALAIALRYEAEPGAPFLAPTRALLDPAGTARAEVLGTAFRLAYTLSAGTPALLAGTELRLLPGRLTLRLHGAGVFDGEGIRRRLERLAAVLGVVAAVE